MNGPLPADAKQALTERVAIEDKYPLPNIPVNYVGFPREKCRVKMSQEDWGLTIRTMLKCAFLACKAAMPHMIEQGRGRVICISSRPHFGIPTRPHYSAANTGLIGMAKALTIEEGRYGRETMCIGGGQGIAAIFERA